MTMIVSAFEQWVQRVGFAGVLDTCIPLLPDTVAIFAVDQDRNVIFWNEAAEKHLQLKAEDILGQNCRKANRCQECLVGCPIAEFGRVYQQPVTFYLDEGQAVTLEKTAVAFFDEEGLFAGGVEILQLPKLAEEEEGQSLPVSYLEEDDEDEPGPYIALTESDETEVLGEMVTRDPKMKRVFQVVRNIAETDATVLIHGESGTGKELTAHAIHQGSHRKDGPFVAVNCGALTPSLLESELFGHAKGAFTGAVSKRIGLFERADGGTIFLDEIAEMPIHLQSKLLRVLEEREVIPLGDSEPIKVNIRVISATHKSLPKEVKEGRFREDLMYRLRVVPIHLPPLRERRKDLRLLVWHLIERYNIFGPRAIKEIDTEAANYIRRYPWPGNVRELRNAIEYAFAVGRDEVLSAEELPYDVLEYESEASLHNITTQTKKSGASVTTVTSRPPSSKESELASHERQKILQALEEAEGHVGKAAASLGMSRPTLWRKRKKYGL